jgi:hypothetical protein
MPYSHIDEKTRPPDGVDICKPLQLKVWKALNPKPNCRVALLISLLF